MKTKERSLEYGYTIEEICSCIAPFMKYAAFQFHCDSKVVKKAVTVIDVYFTQEEECSNIAVELFDELKECGFEMKYFPKLVGNIYGDNREEYKTGTLMKASFLTNEDEL